MDLWGSPVVPEPLPPRRAEPPMALYAGGGSFASRVAQQLQLEQQHMVQQYMMRVQQQRLAAQMQELQLRQQFVEQVARLEAQREAADRAGDSEEARDLIH